MEIKGIKYIAPMFDNSGYSQAARGNIMALHQKGIPLTLSPISFETARPDLGTDGEILKSLVNKEIDYNIVIMHMTPEFYEKYREADKINVAYTIWETDKLHPKWPLYINDNVDKVLVGCEWNVEVFKNSGVTKPIGVVPHGINMDSFKDIKPFGINGLTEDDFVFYDIMQFTERKNPLALVKAYWYAFQDPKDKVALVLKTYRNDYSDQEKDTIKRTIRRLKKVTPADYYPKILLILNMLSDEEMLGLHKKGDCYASLDRGEGFGLGAFTSGAIGNPVIITGLGGVTEYAKPDNSYLANYTKTPVFGMPWSSSMKSIVSTQSGHKQIKDLTVEDNVINKNGVLKGVIKVGHRDLLPAEKMYSIKYMSVYEGLEVTNTHKLYVVTDKDIVKKKVSDIQKGDYLIVPKPNTTLYNTDIDLLNYTYSDKWSVSDNKLYCVQSNNGNLPTKRFIELSNGLFYLVGLYLAEGCIYKSNNVLSFSFNINERDTLAAKCKSLLIDVFGIHENKINIREYKDRDGCEVTISSLPVANFFKETFLTGSHNKRIPYEWKLNNIKSFRENLLIGYWLGDGHIRKHRKVNNKNMYSRECVATTASASLVLDIRDLLLSLNILPSLTKNIRKDGRISYVLSVNNLIFDELLNVPKRTKSDSSFHYYEMANGDFAVRVKSNDILADFEGQVYSVSVAPDSDETDSMGGSYILNGIASSNSPWYRLDQLWAESDILDGANKMRYVYENQKEAKKKGLKLQKYISENFTWDIIGNKIIKEIEKL